MDKSNDEGRGLASASNETRKRVAKMGGEASGKARREKKDSEESSRNREDN